MKNTFITLLLLCSFVLMAQGQNNAIHISRMDAAGHEHTPGRNCAAHTVLQEQMQADPVLEHRMLDMEEKTQRYMREARGSAARFTAREIPVYVHVIYRTSQENISDAQIQSQIDQINADFAASNSDYNPPSDFASVASGNTGISFKLVRITRKQTSKTSWGTSDDMKKASKGGVDPITPTTHLNMWVCNIGNSILGYAQFPGGNLSTDGVVMSPQYFGSRNYGNASNYYLSAPYDKGRTTTHEIGHYLNLRHIWGDGGCNVDDGVSDTPVAGQSNSGCPSATQNTCAGGQRDMHMNYMDYTNDACMYMFSNGQKLRMQACLEGPRSQLGTPNGGGGGGGTPTCYSNITLSITTDQYASETSWVIKNAAGTTVASGNGYANNATVNPAINLPAGNYTFTINDSYGDGICCNYGNGSYTLSGDGTAIKTGSNFGSSESTAFCIGAACNQVELILDFDNYASETSWSLRNAAGATLHSGNGYANGNDKINQTFCLPDGCYDFVINDSHGDGICCNYGNGSYRLVANGNTLASGASFTSSETKRICLNAARQANPNVQAFAVETLTEIRLFPNPANQTINAELFNIDEPLMGRIVDATGRTLWVGQLEAGQNSINISTLPTGLYHLAVVRKDGQTMTEKFIKQ